MSAVEDAMNARAKAVFLIAFATSLVLHGVAFASLASHSATDREALEASTVSFEVDAPSPPEPELAPQNPEPPAPRSLTPAPTRTDKAPPKIPNQAASSPAPTHAATEAAALDLRGVTLTNDSGAGFSVPAGDGSALYGPIGAAGARVLDASSAPAPARLLQAPAIVAVNDLSERPRPPPLEGLLRANYPEAARARGQGGSASVRARIERDGVIRGARLVTESGPGFGSACRRTLLGSRWSAPRAKNGDAVATEIVYTCHFEVE